MRAPTAGNMMLYSILEITEQSIKDKLAVSCDNQPFIAESPLVLIYAADYQRTFDYFEYSGVKKYCEKNGVKYRTPGEGDLMLSVDDSLIAAQTAVIAAEALGLGSCYIGDIMENYEFNRDLLNLPDYVFPAAMLCIGYPANPEYFGKLTERFDSEFIRFKNSYKRLTPTDFTRMYGKTNERYSGSGCYPMNAGNHGQYLYARKFSADYSIEMDRSVRKAIMNWKT